jgi:hypothetical protein
LLPELEAGEVVPGDAQQDVGAAIEGEQLGVRADDQQDRDGTQEHRRLEQRAPAAARRAGRAGQLAGRHRVPGSRSVPSRSASRTETSTYDSESPLRLTNELSSVASGRPSSSA